MSQYLNKISDTGVSGLSELDSRGTVADNTYHYWVRGLVLEFCRLASF